MHRLNIIFHEAIQQSTVWYEECAGTAAGKNCSLRGGRGEERGVAAVGFTCSRSGMIARTALPLRSSFDRSVALAEAPEVLL